MMHWLAAAAASVLTAAGPSEAIPLCKGFEVHLRIAAPSIRRGERPQFTLVVRNTSKTPLRLLDTRNGRRPDLGNTYYDLVVRARDGEAADVLRVISDPGPISSEDYFAIAPDEVVELSLTTALALQSLKRGTYKAHVAVWVDPYQLQSICRSDSLEFRVQ